MTRALIVLQKDDDREMACRWARGVPLGSRIEFKETKRTLPQNDLMWALLTEVSRQLKHGDKKYDPEQWKSIFLHAFGREITFLPSLDLKTFLPIELSSSDLGKDEMTNFIEFIIKEGTERGVIFRDHNNEASDAPAPSASDEGSGPPQDSTTLPNVEPEGASPSPSPSGSDLAKWNYEGADLTYLREFAAKGIKEARKSNIVASVPAKIDFLNQMRPKYIAALASADAVTALESIKRALELVIEGERDINRIEAWIEVEFLSCEPADLVREAADGN